MNRYVCIYIYIYVCIQYTSIYVHIYIYICIYIYMRKCMVKHTQMRTMVLEYGSLQNWATFGFNVGKYSIHGASGIYIWEMVTDTIHWNPRYPVFCYAHFPPVHGFARQLKKCMSKVENCDMSNGFVWKCSTPFHDMFYCDTSIYFVEPYLGAPSSIQVHASSAVLLNH